MFRRLRFALEYMGAGFLMGVASILPLRMMRPLGAALGWIAFCIIRIRRSVSLENIQSALGRGEREACVIGRDAYMNLGRSLVEFAAFRHLSADDVRGMVTVEGAEHFDEALRHGKGAVLFTGHFGNWELVAAWIAQSRYPIHVLVAEQANPWVDGLMNALRRSQSVQVITKGSELRQIVRALSKNEFVAMVGDQDARGAGVFVDFLGKPASTFRGPARLAIQLGCPIIVGFVMRRPEGGHVAEIKPLLWPDPALEGEEALLELTQRCTAHLESYVRAFPDHYFWAHRRWKTRPGTRKDGSPAVAVDREGDG